MTRATRLLGRKHIMLAAMMSGGLAPLAIAPAVAAQDAQVAVRFDIPRQSLATALLLFGRQAGMQVTTESALVEGKIGQAVEGRLAPAAALSRLLTGTGLTYRMTDGGVQIAPSPVAAGYGQDDTIQLGPVRVRGNADGESIAHAEDEEHATGPAPGYVARRSGTGTKTDTSLIETPQSLSVITADQIEATGSLRLADALAYTPGVDVAANGTDSRYDWLTVRGFDLYSPGFYLDGLALRNVGNFAVWQIENYAAERIEVLRGPASVLYGLSNGAGMVNVVSKRPTAERRGEVQAQWGTYGRKQVMADVSGPVDAQGTLLYRMIGLARDARLPAGGMPDDRVFVAPSLTWQPNAATSLTLLGQYAHVHAGVYTRGRRAVGSLVPTVIGTTIPVDFSSAEPDFDRLRQDQWSIGYLLEQRLGSAWKVRQNLRFSEVDSDLRQISAGDFAKVDAINPRDPSNFQSVTRTVFLARDNSRNFGVDTQVEGQVDTGPLQHTLLFGVDYQNSRFDTVLRFGPAPAINVYRPVYGQAVTIPGPYQDSLTRLAQTGLYAQDQMKLADRWVATIGVRYDHAITRLTDRASGSAFRIGDDKATTRAGLVYLGRGGWAPYVSYSSSFTPTATIDPLTGRAFKPETGRQYEAGLRFQPVGRNDSYSVALFDLRRKNYITYDQNFMPKQTGEALVRGLEFEGKVEPLPGMNLIGAYSFTPIARVISSATPAAIGRQAVAMSRHKASLWVDQRFDGGLQLGAGGRYVGPNRGNEEAVRPYTVPAYVVLDALAAIDLARWRLAINARNLLDKAYFANCDAFGSCYYGEPRRVTATLSFRW
jgi:iron complex outermembrane receptor protein